MKKRILSLLCVLCLLLTMLPTSAFAAGYDAPTLSIEATYNNTDGTVEAKVIIGACTDLAGIDFHLKFNKEKLTVKEKTANPKFGTGSLMVVAVNDDYVGLCASPDNVTTTSNETILTVVFNVIAGKSGNVEFSFDETATNFTDSTGDNTADAPGAGSVTSANVTIPKAPITSVTASVAGPVAGQPLDFAGTVDSSAPYSITKVEWFESTNANGTVVTNPSIAKANQYYYARITLTANDGETFAESLDNTNSGDYSVTRKSGTELYLTKAYPETGSLPAASVTDAPTAKTGLKYNGSEQVLLGFQGTANGGSMQYSLNGTTWTDTVPTGKDAKTYTVYYKAKGDSSHSDSAVANVSVKIDPKDISGTTIETITDKTYTGSAITPEPTVKDGTAILTKDTDYTVSCSNTYVGTATLTINGKGNYTGTKNANFTIVAADQNPTFTSPVDLAKGGHRLDLRTLVSGAKGDVMTFTIDGVTSIHAVLEDGHTLTSTGIPGTVNINVSITAKNEGGDNAPEYNAYSGSSAIIVNVIDKTTNTETMKVSQDDITYGATVSPAVTNKPDGTDEVSYTYVGRDGTTYSSSATAPTNVGKYKVKAKCESSTIIYTAEDDFEILPKSISGMTVTLDNTSLEYNGSAQTVNVTVKDGASTLTKDTDYTVTGATSGTNVNSYTVTVTGKGNYKGSVDRTWKITQGTPTYTVPTGLTATFGQKLANITLPTGWSWMDSTQPVGDASTTPKTFKAKFTPTDTTNYKTVENIDVSVAVGKATAPTLTNITVSQKYTVTTGEKAIGAVMPADAGTLTYAKGTAATTGSVTVTSWDVDSTGKVTYTLSGGAAGDTVTLPVIIKSTNFADATVNVVITLTAKDDQAALTLTGGTTVVYGQTLQLGTSGGSGTGAVTYAVTNGTGEATIDATGKLTPVKVGTVKVKATKAEDANYNAITSAEVEITITRATPTGAPKYTAITTRGKTLADAGLTTAGSTLNPNAGTLVWVDNAGNVLPDTTAVAANTTYKWLFTPNDTNYTTLTGSIELYHKSSSGGGGRSYTYYTIKAEAGTNGSISPSGWASVRLGRDQTFTITPDKGYAVAKVLVDGKSVGAVKSYTFKDVRKDHTIEAIFMKSNGNPQTGVFVDVAEGSYYGGSD